MRVVVFGASGNLGSSLFERLASDPEVDALVGVARRRPGSLPDGGGSGPDVSFVEADLAKDDLAAVVRCADVVVHLAWAIQPMHDPGVTWDVNVGGTHRLLAAVEAERVPAFVYSSSVGAYAPTPPDRRDERFDESYPTTGMGTVHYAMQKAYDERLLDAFEAAVPACRVVRLRPGLVLMAEAGEEYEGLFLGPVANVLFRLAVRAHLPVPLPADLRFQVVHSADVAAALREACTRDVRGAFNLAAEPVVRRDDLAAAMGTRAVGMPWKALRAGAQAAFTTRLSPLHEGWIDLIHRAPLMDTTRAREELGWTPSVGALDALREAVGGVIRSESRDTPPLS